MFNIFSNLKEGFCFQIKGLLLLTLSLLCFVGLKFTGQIGTVGEMLIGFFCFIAGDLAFLIPLLIFLLSFKYILPSKIDNIDIRFAGLVIISLLLLAVAHLNLTAQIPLERFGMYETGYNLGIQKQGGGVLGALLSMVLFFFFGKTGSYIVISAFAIIAFLLILNISLTQFFDIFKKIFSWLFSKTKVCVSKSNHIFTKKRATKKTEQKPPLEENALAENVPIVIKDNNKNHNDKIQTELLEQEETQEESQPDYEVNSDENTTGYNLPSTLLLPQEENPKDAQQKQAVLDRAKDLENALKNFEVQIKNIQAHMGPTVTRYEVQPAKGVKVSQIVNLANDLALNMAAPAVRIEAPIPGKSAVGVEVPNNITSSVYLRSVLESSDFKNSKSLLSIGLGKNVYGEVVVADLAKMPHILIAGATGSGKSVCLNTLITSILFKAMPDEVKLLLIDPKYVELNSFNGIPHLLAPVISNKKKASSALKKMVKEMEDRYEMFAQEGVKDIENYNNFVKNEKDEPEKVLPYIVVVIDELADIMLASPQEVEDTIARLSQMARAAGIHLVLATQRPSVNVITGVIKANITTRIAFAVSSTTDSRVILDMGGAEKLVGQGDMLYHPVGIQKPRRIQGAFISEQDVNKIVDYIKNQEVEQQEQEFIPESNEELEEPEEVDEVFIEAVREVVNSGQASISSLQRRLRIGHVRAGRLIDEMEKLGIISSFEGSKARKALITPEQLDQYIEKFNKQ